MSIPPSAINGLNKSQDQLIFGVDRALNANVYSSSPASSSSSSSITLNKAKELLSDTIKLGNKSIRPAFLEFNQAQQVYLNEINELLIIMQSYQHPDLDERTKKAQEKLGEAFNAKKEIIDKINQLDDYKHFAENLPSNLTISEVLGHQQTYYSLCKTTLELIGNRANIAKELTMETQEERKVMFPGVQVRSCTTIKP